MNSPILPVFTPNQDQINQSHLSNYISWINNHYGKNINDYYQLWQWSIDNYKEFWTSIFEYFSIAFDGDLYPVLSKIEMPGIEWFQNLSLNYAEHLPKHAAANPLALISIDEKNIPIEWHWNTILEKSAALQQLLISNGLIVGDRVTGYLNNIPEASIALFTSIASGFVWSSVSPDFGASSVIDRFSQIEPKVLIAVDEYQYGGKIFNRSDQIRQIIASIPTIKLLILVRSKDCTIYNSQIEVIKWDDIQSENNEPKPVYHRVPFNHPIWILYSSGTTGAPKAITHSHGGMLLEHLKYVHFHNDIKVSEKYFWYTSTGWMMWNFLHSTWLAGSTILLYDGHPMFPSNDILWRQAETFQINHFGTSAPYIHACMKESVVPHFYSGLKSISSTGSPLNPEAYEWIYNHFKEIYLWSISGGTDMCTAFVGGCPIWPVYIGEIQCKTLGCSLVVLNEQGEEVSSHKVGELVIDKPMPCMPIYFWNDPTGEKYLEAYFELFPGKWRHGDWIMITENDGLVIHGRSDTTLKRHGVRIGTAEIYNSLATISEIEDSVIIHIDKENSEPWMPLFLKLKVGHILSDQLKRQIITLIKKVCSPRHVPDDFFQVDDIPYTLSGKKMESLVKKIFQGKYSTNFSSKGSIKNEECIDQYLQIFFSLAAS